MVGPIKHRIWHAAGITFGPFAVYNIYKRYHQEHAPVSVSVT